MVPADSVLGVASCLLVDSGVTGGPVDPGVEEPGCLFADSGARGG